MLHKATIFCIDTRRQVVRSRDVEFTCRKDLVRQLEPSLSDAALVEAWEDGVLVLRLTGAHGGGPHDLPGPGR